ncbi:MAG: argininosuccinate lyase [Fusobacteriaceae bacterium]|jgi:argininosuccinate lyase|nr:argininosuccinate lyase [Fusobacteriaceae bacterium]
MKLWGGRFNKESSKLLEKFNASITFDIRMYKEDIMGSIAHSKMLAKQNIISNKEQEKIEKALKEIELEIDNDELEFSLADEDIHMAIEKRLIQKIGDTGKKLHTARSRNDQVALDIRLYLKKEINNIKQIIIELLEVIKEVAKNNKDVILPGYTHLQRAQPILFAHHLLAYFEMLKRDYDRLNDLYKRVDVMPLGSSALAGTTYNIDRHFVAKELGFSKVTNNSLDSVSDRDFIAETNFVIAMIAMHMSRFSEEIILWATSEFGFINLDDAYSTGSSIMPQKKNPDIAELVRGKTGRIYGNLISILTVMKGLPLAYNKDTQEDKEGVFDSIDNIKISLEIFKEMLATIKVNKENMIKDIYKGFINATDIADYLAKKGIPFREAHEVVGKLVAYCEENNKYLNELTFEEYKKFNSNFEEDIIEKAKIETCIKDRNSYGGTSYSEVERQLNEAEEFIKNNKI